MSRKIKKYVNRKLYDTTEKKYISLDDLSDMVKAGEQVSIEDNETSEDITSSVLSQILARENTSENDSDVSGILTDLLRKGKGTVLDYAKKYNALWQNTLTMAEDEVDKLVKMLVKNKEITESEAGRLKGELMGYAESFKSWITDKIDQRVNEGLEKMNLATNEQVVMLSAKVESLTKTVEKLEKLQTEVPSQESMSDET